MAKPQKKSAKKNAKPKAEKKAAKRKIARQERLPGMADAKISALHNAALGYVEIRDQRQELTTQEVELKQRLLDLMHKNQKTTYDYNGVHVELVTESETVKVRVRSPEDPEAPVKVDKRTEFNPPEEETAGEPTDGDIPEEVLQEA